MGLCFVSFSGGSTWEICHLGTEYLGCEVCTGVGVVPNAVSVTVGTPHCARGPVLKAVGFTRFSRRRALRPSAFSDVSMFCALKSMRTWLAIWARMGTACASCVRQERHELRPTGLHVPPHTPLVVGLTAIFGPHPLFSGVPIREPSAHPGCAGPRVRQLHRVHQGAVGDDRPDPHQRQGTCRYFRPRIVRRVEAMGASGPQ